MGTQPPPQKGGRAPQFSAHVYCGQTAAWIKMPLGTEVGFSPGDLVLDGAQLSPEKKHTPPNFVPCLLWPNGWMDEDATWYGRRAGHRPHCIRRGPSCTRKGHISPPPLFAHVYCGHGRPSQLLLSSCYLGIYLLGFTVQDWSLNFLCLQGIYLGKYPVNAV